MSAIIRSTRMPMSWAATGFSAVARSAWPTTVRVKNSVQRGHRSQAHPEHHEVLRHDHDAGDMRPFGRYGWG